MRWAPLVTLALAMSLSAQIGSPWQKIEFLIGDWVGVANEKETQPGAGQGSFSFQPELQQKIVVRRNNAHYDSGAQHDDLMLIYLDPPNGAPRAIYFDTEGHVIRYNLSFPAMNRAVFESEPGQPGPKYRLTYWMDGQTLDGRFEVADPDGEYKTYLSWASKRAR